MPTAEEEVAALTEELAHCRQEVAALSAGRLGDELRRMAGRLAEADMQLALLREENAELQASAAELAAARRGPSHSARGDAGDLEGVVRRQQLLLDEKDAQLRQATALLAELRRDE